MTSQTIRRLLIMGAILCVSVAVGGFAAIGFDLIDPKWYAYVVVALVFCAVLLLVGNAERVLMATIVLTLPASICFSIYSLRELRLLIYSFDVASWGLFLLAGIRSLAAKNDKRLKCCAVITGPFVALVCASGLSLLVAGDRGACVIATYNLSRCVVLYLAVLYFVRKKADIAYILNLLLVMLLVYAAMYTVQIKLGYSFDLAGNTQGGRMLNMADSETVRLVGANAAGGTFSSLCALLVARLLIEKTHFWRFVATVALVIGLTALIFTLSRGSWLAFVLAVPIVMLLSAKKTSLNLGGPLMLMCVVVIVALAVGNLAMTRITTDDQGAAESRIPLMKQALYMISHNPVFGVGAGNYAYEMTNYIPPGSGYFWEYTVHNDYLLFWAECGTFGFLALLWLLFTYGAVALRDLRDPGVTSQNLGLMCFAFFVALLPHLFFEAGSFGRETGWLLSVLLGLLASNERIRTAAPALSHFASAPNEEHAPTPFASTSRQGRIIAENHRGNDSSSRAANTSR